MKHTDAVKIAMEFVTRLREVSSVIFVAGSLRRLKPEVKDIEIVALIPTDKRSAMYKLLEQIAYWKKGTGTNYKPARYMQWQHKTSGIMLDLFLPTERDYFRQLVIRTGSAEYIKRVIASAWVNKGWVGTDNGLRLRSECVKPAITWICNTDEPTLPPVWKSEKEFFQWLGVNWCEPKARGL